MRSADTRLSAAAERDIIEILRISLEDFGRDGALRYQHLIATALEDLATDSSRNGVVRRPELAADVYSYHLRHSRERASPFRDRTATKAFSALQAVSSLAARDRSAASR